MAARPAQEQDTRQRRDFRRMVVASMIAHAAALGLVVTTPDSKRSLAPTVITVDLVSIEAPRGRPAPPRPAAPRPPEPVPTPPAPAPPPKPVAPTTVLPEKPRGPQPDQRPPPRREEVVIEPGPRQERSLDDLLSEFRDDTDAPAPEPTPAPAPESARAPAATPGAGTPVEPETARWIREAKRHVRRAWVVPPGFRTQVLETHVTITLDASGNVVGAPRIARSSGNPWYDEGVVRGIEKASPLPPPPDPGDWDFVFVPEDSF